LFTCDVITSLCLGSVRIVAIFVYIPVQVINPVTWGLFSLACVFFTSNMIGRTSCDHDVVLSDWARVWSRDCDVTQSDWAAQVEPYILV
jgi:hypothetical protein